jgi:nitrogen fixation-related uncharacterized protein
MLAFLIFTAILLGCMGLLHTFWNRKRDEQDKVDAQSIFPSPLEIGLTRQISR